MVAQLGCTSDGPVDELCKGAQLARASPDMASRRPSFPKTKDLNVKPAPTKAQSRYRLAGPLTLAVLTNPALEEIHTEFARQDRELEAAFSSVSGLADVPFAVR
ncbi:MAG TPA: hypothetical protein VGJ91_21435, partial [Polyangiaceae bacterium]